MDTLVKILGVVFVVLLLVIGGGLLYLRFKLRQLFNGLGDALEGLGAGGMGPMPPRLHLRRRESIEWEHRGEVESLVADLAERGFVDAGRYEVDEMYGLSLQAMTNVEQAVTNVIYEMEPVGVWVDFVTRYASGGSLTVSSAPQGGEMDYPPDHVKIYDKAATPLELYDRLLAERRDEPYAPVQPEEFADVMAQAYADEMDWRNLRGYATEDEVRRIAAASGEDLTDETLQAMLSQYADHAAEGLSQAARERYLATCDLSAAEWEKVSDRVVVVHYRLTTEMVCTLVEYQFEQPDSEGDDDDDDEYDPLAPLERLGGEAAVVGLSAREIFRRFNDLLPDGRRFRQLGSVVQPLEAELWVMAES